MGLPTPVLTHRVTSFNPEAATFNPGFRFSTPDTTELCSPPTGETTPYRFPMAPMFNYSPFHGSGDPYSLYRRDTFPPAPVPLEDLMSPAAQASLAKMENSHCVQEAQETHMMEQKPNEIADVVAGRVDKISTPMVGKQQAQTAYNTIDINELSAGLGLPVARVRPSGEASRAVSPKSLDTRAQPGTMYGQLMGWALDKPLTAEGLAAFLKTQDLRTLDEFHAAASASLTNTVVRHDASINQLETMNTSPSRIDHGRVASMTSVEAVSVQQGSSAYQHQQRRSSASSASYPRHTHVSSNKRYLRRPSRTKRMDQGPMPSAADIYPDDAHWTPFAPLHEAFSCMNMRGPLIENLRPAPVNDMPASIDDVVNRPPLVNMCSSPEPVAPTAADFGAADKDVLALLEELPEPSLDTLARLGNSQDLRHSTAFDLPCDSRALSPAQVDGSRYGMRFYGLGLGDEWWFSRSGENKSPMASPQERHDLGGHDWALRQVWVA